MIDLLAEFAEQAATATRRDDAMLDGVDHGFLWSGPSRYAVSPIETSRDGTYEPAESGELAIIVPLAPLDFWHVDNDPMDLVAFRPSRPEKWWLRLGVGQLLNPDAVLRAEITRQPIEVWSTPLRWLQSGGRGIVIVDWRANLRFHLGGVARIVPDSAALGDLIGRRCRNFGTRTPEIAARRAA